ncbi:MAG TPA: hypothetical protein PLH82_00910, partial [Candidatus Paceibacterota bacterium]|nr:hypothetical protein [Candidatus Paceibacterota bacterium]
MACVLKIIPVGGIGTPPPPTESQDSWQLSPIQRRLPTTSPEEAVILPVLVILAAERDPEAL